MGNKTAGIHAGHRVPSIIDKEGRATAHLFYLQVISHLTKKCRFHTLSHNYDRKRGLEENVCGTMRGEGGMVPNGSFGTLLLEPTSPLCL